MPNDEVDKHMAEIFPVLVSDLQNADVAAFDERHKAERMQRALLRQAQPNPGMNAGEFLKKLDGDPEEEQRKIQEDLARIAKEAAEATAKKVQNEPLPVGHFPPPPTTE